MGLPLSELLSCFWSNYSPEPNTGCWLWTGSIDNDGYPKFHKTVASRTAYELSTGRKIEFGFEIHHKCGCRACINPSHLLVLSVKEHKALHSALHSKRRKRIWVI